MSSPAEVVPASCARSPAPRLAPRLAPRVAAPPRRRAPRAARSRTPIELTVEVLRGPFRPLIVWGLFWGPRPFSELMRHVPDVTKRALRRELVEMERIGLVRARGAPDSNRRASYSLSPFGETLRPVVGAMYEWGLLCAEPRRSSQDARAQRSRAGAVAGGRALSARRVPRSRACASHAAPSSSPMKASARAARLRWSRDRAPPGSSRTSTPPALGERSAAQRPHDREARVGARVVREGLDLRAQRRLRLLVAPEAREHVAAHELEPRHRAEARARRRARRPGARAPARGARGGRPPRPAPRRRAPGRPGRSPRAPPRARPRRACRPRAPRSRAARARRRRLGGERLLARTRGPSRGRPSRAATRASVSDSGAASSGRLLDGLAVGRPRTRGSGRAARARRRAR